MQGCPEGRFTSRVDFEIRAPQIAANAVLKYMHSVDLLFTRTSSIDCRSRYEDYSTAELYANFSRSIPALLMLRT
jgi:hypothetical protein